MNTRCHEGEGPACTLQPVRKKIFSSIVCWAAAFSLGQTVEVATGSKKSQGGSAVPTVRLRRLGAAFRRLREDRGMNLEEAGALMERSISSLSKLENGRVKLPTRDVRAMLDFYGVTDERTREGLVSLARDSHKQGWWQQYGDSLSASYLDLISLEADASAVRTFQTSVIPGLLQTPDYARALIAAVPGPTGPLDVDQLVTVRMTRRELLTGPDPLHLWAILDEAALHRHIGGRATMHAQLVQLIEASQTENVVIQVLPYTAGAHAGTSGPFTTLEFPEPTDLDVVLVESLTSGLYLETTDEIRRYSLVFDHLRMSALPQAESRALIRQAAKGIE